MITVKNPVKNLGGCKKVKREIFTLQKWILNFYNFFDENFLMQSQMRNNQPFPCLYLTNEYKPSSLQFVFLLGYNKL